MSLVRWDGTGDNFSHTQLASNFTLIDQHDHTSGKGVQIPPGGLANLSVGTAQLADGSVTNSKISGSSPISDVNLASPNNSAYRALFSLGTKVTSSNPTGNYLFASGPTLLAPSTATSTIVPVYYLNVNDYAVANKSPVLQVLVTILTNSVAPGITYTVGLNATSVDAANATSGNLAYLLGSQIANSTSAIATPAQNSSSEQASVDFAFPTTGFYTLGINLSGTPGAGSVAAVHAQLRVRNT